jgi:hypothetical protein
VSLACLALPLAAGCGAPRARPSLPVPPAAAPGTAALPAIGHSIQVGAFAEQENAVRLSERLEQLGLEAFHFADEDGLYKVRFGAFDDRASAVARAESLRLDGIVDAYYVVPPERYRPAADEQALRRGVVRSAMGFLGQPYQWGASQPTGLDCSGLAMAAYRLNGIALPRTSLGQYEAGNAIALDELREADLVFFATGDERKPTHVGLYAGDGRFVHAPSSGKVVRVDTLAAEYYRARLVGARTYFPGGS